MKYLLSGGGTGGHITPILAVAGELKNLQPDCYVVYVGERKSKFADLTNGTNLIDEKWCIYSGKFRRYHGQSMINRLLDLATIFKNLRDAVYVIIGVLQSIRILRKTKPDIVFLKGGYVGVPIGLAAVVLGIPIATHDSDAVPGLANRIVSRWAKIHATAHPKDNYSYPHNKIKVVGVLVDSSYLAVKQDTQIKYKNQLKLSAEDQFLLITGGSSGAVRLNRSVAEIIPKLLAQFPKLQIIHQVGKGKLDVYGDYRHERLKIIEFMTPMYVYSGAADLIVTRAGANTLAEFGTQGKACIVIPNPDLTGGHQANAEILAEQGAAVVVSEDKITDSQHGLYSKIESLLKSDKERNVLSQNIQKTTITNAAKSLAKILIDNTNN